MLCAFYFLFLLAGCLVSLASSFWVLVRCIFANSNMGSGRLLVHHKTCRTNKQNFTGIQSHVYYFTFCCWCCCIAHRARRSWKDFYLKKRNPSKITQKGSKRWKEAKNINSSLSFVLSSSLRSPVRFIYVYYKVTNCWIFIVCMQCVFVWHFLRRKMTTACTTMHDTYFALVVCANAFVRLNQRHNDWYSFCCCFRFCSFDSAKKRKRRRKSLNRYEFELKLFSSCFLCHFFCLVALFICHWKGNYFMFNDLYNALEYELQRIVGKDIKYGLVSNTKLCFSSNRDSGQFWLDNQLKIARTKNSMPTNKTIELLISSQYVN